MNSCKLSLSPHVFYDMCTHAHKMNNLNNLKVLGLLVDVAVYSISVTKRRKFFEVKDYQLFIDLTNSSTLWQTAS